MKIKQTISKNLWRVVLIIAVCANLQLDVNAQVSPGYQPAQFQDANTAWMNNGTHFAPAQNVLPPSVTTYTPNVIDTGTVLNGILQEDVSSKKSKNADVFSIMLPENYMVNNRLLIPQYSKFVGSVVSVSPAKKAKQGNPGNLQVSIQTLVTPDGISVPVSAFIDYNPNENTKTDLKKKPFIPVGEWAQSARYAVLYYGGGLGSRLGVPVLYKGQTNGGQDFSLTKGEILPIRLTMPLDTTPLWAGKNQMPNFSGNSAPGMIQNTLPIFSASPSPGMIQNNQPAFPTNAPSNNMIPGTSGQAGPEPF